MTYHKRAALPFGDKTALTSTEGTRCVKAAHTLPRSPAICKVPKSGVLTLCGFGCKLRVDGGHLCAEWGIGLERYQARLPRVGHGLRRLVLIGSDGYITISALEWLADVGVSLTFLDRMGKVRFVTGPTAPSDARLRIAQVSAIGEGVGLEISRTLIDAKLEGQERLVRERLNNPATADLIAGFRARLANAEKLESIRTLEAHAAVEYWSAWHDVPILFPRKDARRVPEHWKRFGARRSPLTGGPRLAVNPANGLLNFIFALVESGSRLALTTLGLNPEIGYLHLPRANRDSLALDVMEPVRPDVERWVYQWISTEPLRKADFFETRTGNVRLMSHLCSKLSATAPTWGKLLAPWAEYVARALWDSTSQSKSARSIPTHLTQQHRRESKGQPSFPRIEVPRPEHVCSDCGAKIRRNNKLCSKCSKRSTRVNFRAGRKNAQEPEFLAKRSATQHRHRDAIRNWDPSKLPASLTREFYASRIVPALAKVPKAQIRAALGVSEPYSIYIQTGKRIPHPRHWQVLAQLVGGSAG